MHLRKSPTWQVVLFLGAWAPASWAGDSAAPSKDDSLPPGARARLGSSQLVHSNQVYTLLFTPDGKQLISTGADGQVCFWDVRTGREVRRINPSANANPGVFNPYWTFPGITADGKVLGLSVSGKAVMLYEAGTGKFLREVGEAGPGIGLPFAFAPDGKHLVGMGRNVNEKSARLYDINSGNEIRKFEGHDNFVVSAAFTPDGKTLITGSEDQTIRLWEVDTGKSIRTLEGHRAGVYGVAVSPDGKRIASVSNDGTLRIWDAETGNQLHRFNSMRIYYNGLSISHALRFADDGATLTAALTDGVHRWEVASGKELRKPSESQAATYGVYAASSDGKLIAQSINNQTGRIALLDAVTGKELHAGRTVNVQAMAISPDSKYLATGGIDHLIHLWDMSTAHELRIFEGHTGTVSFLFFSGDGKRLMSASRDYNDRAISVWDVETGKELHTIRTGGNNLMALSASRDGRVLARLQQEQQGPTISFIDTQSCKEIRRVRQASYFYTLALSPNGKSYVTQAQDGTFTIADAADDKDSRVLLRGAQGMPYFSHDGQMIAVVGQDMSIRMLDVKSGRELYQLGEKADPALPGRGRIRQVYNPWNQAVLTFSADGRMLATPGKDHGVALWEIATGKQRGSFVAHQGLLTCLAFAPDGKTLVSAGQDGQLIFWDLVQGTPDDLQNGEHLTLTKLKELWTDLEGDDAAKAYRATRLLRAASKISLPFLFERLQPAAAVDPKKLEKLIEQLDSIEYDERTQATRELIRLGELVEPALRRALETRPSLEVVKRIEEVLQKAETRTLTGDRLRAYRALEVLEPMTQPDARQLLEKLAAGAEGAGLTKEAKAALERQGVSTEHH